MINELAKEIHQNAKDHGFFDEERNIGEMLALIHSEVSEALEADRNGNYFNSEKQLKPNDKSFGNAPTKEGKWYNFFEKKVKHTFEDELADIMIRVMDLAAYKNIDLESHIIGKMRYNSLREYKHGKNY